MFWQLFPDDVISARENVPDPNRVSVWWEEKDQMDFVTGRIWPNYEWSKRAWHTRDYVLNEFCQIFVDDRHVHRDAINIHANVQSKAVFSYAMAVMDKICGLEKEETWVGSPFSACVWIYTKAVLCDEQEIHGGILQAKEVLHHESVNWVREEAFEGHEWVSELTISRMEEHALVDLEYDIDIPCVVQWGLLWFSASSRLNRNFDANGAKIVMFHEVTNLAIKAAFSVVFRWIQHAKGAPVEIGCRGPGSCI